MNTKNCMSSRKREGFALALTLIIVVVGLLIVSAMFSSVRDFTGFFSEYRRAYTDIITANSYIERVKGRIVAINNARASFDIPVLHGSENQDRKFNTIITHLNGLIISGDEFTPGFEDEFIIGEESTVNGPQVVIVRVYDANYNVETIDEDEFTDADFNELPPSFFIAVIDEPDWKDIGSDGSDYNQFESPYDDARALYDKYGAYLIRVKIYNLVGRNNRPVLVRTTEETFVQVIP